MLIELLRLFVKVAVDNSGVNRALADTEKRAEATNRAGEGVGDGFERGAKKSTGALGRITKAISATRKDAARGISVDVSVDSGAGEAKLVAFEQARERADGKDIDVAVDVDTGAAMGKLAAFGAALAAMDAGLSAGGTRLTAFAGIATVAAAMFTPLLAGLATVGSLGVSAAAGFGLIGAAAALMVQQVKAGNPAFMGLKRAYNDLKASFEDAFMPAARSLALLSTEVLKFAGSYLPRLGAAAEANVEVLTNGISEFMRLMRQPMQNASFNTLLEASAPIVENLVLGAGRLTAALVNVFATASPWAVKLSGFIANIANQFLKWSQSTAGVNAIKTAVAQSVPVFSALWRMTKNVVGALLSFGASNAGSIAQAIDIISWAVGGAIRAFGQFIGFIGPFGVVIAALSPLFVGLVLVVGTVASAVTALLPVFAAVGAVLSGPVVLAVAAAVAAAALLIANWGRVKAAFSAIRSALAPVFAQLRAGFASMKTQVLPVLTAVGNGIKKGLVTALRFLVSQGKAALAAFRANWPAIKAAVLPVLTAIGRAIRTGVGAAFRFLLSQAKVIVNWFRANWPLIQRTAAAVFNAVKKVIGAALKFVWNNVIKPVLGAIVRFWKTNHTQITNILKAAWKIVRTVVSTAIKAVLGIIKAIMQVITGDWKGAWNTIKNVLKTVWEGIKTVIKSAVEIVKNTLKVAWNTIRSVAQAAWDYIMNTAIGQRVQRGFERVRGWVEDARTWLGNKWDEIKSVASSAWEAISGAIWRPIETAYNKVTEFIGKILGAVNNVLDMVGLPQIGGAEKGTSGGNGNQSPGRGSRPVRGVPVRGYADGGRVRERPGGVYRVAEAGQDEWVINPNSPGYERHLRGAAAEGGFRVERAHRSGRTPRVPANVRRNLDPPWRAGGASLGGTMHTYIPEMQKFVDEANAKFPIYTNTYSNHPPGFEQPYYRERSVDFWGEGGRGSDLSTALHEQTVPWTIDRLGSNLNWLISNGRMLTSAGWGPDTSGFDHYSHQHTTAFAKGPTATGGGSGGSLKASIFSAAWDKTVQPIVDMFLNPLKNSSNVMAQVAGAAAQKVPDGIKQWALEKLGSVSGGSGLSGTPAQNRALGEKMFPNSGLAGSFSDVDAIWTQESGWDHTAQNPTSSAFGIPQFLDSTWAQYGGVSKDAEGQIKKGYMYIGDRYNGSAAEALAFKQANGWYDQGGLIKREHQAVVHPNELYLPLDRPNVMQTAQTALGTAELRGEVAMLRREIRDGLQNVKVSGYGEEAKGIIVNGAHAGGIRAIRSGEGLRAIKSQAGELSTRGRMEVSR